MAKCTQYSSLIQISLELLNRRALEQDKETRCILMHNGIFLWICLFLFHCWTALVRQNLFIVDISIPHTVTLTAVAETSTDNTKHS